MNLSNVNPLELPSLPLGMRSLLPVTAGIYFALSADNEILYIGKSDNIAKRWRQHHHCHQLETRGDVRLAWFLVSERGLLSSIESALIRYFEPPFNNPNVGFGRGCFDTSGMVSNVAQLREKAGLTQRQLAHLVGVTESTIRNLERNRNGVEQIERIVKLCRALKCDADELINYKSVEEGEIA